MSGTFLVITTIFHPTPSVFTLRDGCREAGYGFIAVGDAKSPKDFSLEGCDFMTLEAQLKSGLSTATACVVNHYARKNIGYLEAMRRGADNIFETDDDNMPGANFFAPRERKVKAPVVKSPGWVNVYGYYTDSGIWPRGLPLNHVKTALAPYESLPVSETDCPIQQDLVDGEADIDAICRMVAPLPQQFNKRGAIALSGAWCPFNSQNTRWWPDAFPLLYLPAYCSFRMTDIWRSFVAQRIAYANGWGVLFGDASVMHQRNLHDPMKDFADEIPGYLHNKAIASTLDALSLPSGVSSIPANMRACYEALIALGVIGANERTLLNAWLEDIQAIK